MPNEVTPTQADEALWLELCKGGYQTRASDIALIAAHRVAHEAPLLAQIAELEDLTGATVRNMRLANERVAELEVAGRMAMAAIDDHNSRNDIFRSLRIEKFYMRVPTGSKITCLSDARTALASKDKP